MNSNISEADHRTHEVKVAGLDLHFRTVFIHDSTPTGAQISAAAGFAPNQQVTVLQWFEGILEDIRPDELADLHGGETRFVVVESDQSWRFTIDGTRIDWPAGEILVKTMRQLASVPMNKRIYLEREDEPDVLQEENQFVNLRSSGLERLSSRIPTWQLNVQGVPLTVHAPTILAQDALTQAGFNASQGWHIYLKVEGLPKEEVQLNSVIDLTRPGIEKLRLTPKDVSNGETAVKPIRTFRLLDADEAFLDVHFVGWQSFKDGDRQWVVIPHFELPEGYSATQVDMALEIPPTYPGAQVDMFYIHPAVTLVGGAALPSTEIRVLIQERSFQRWSRHRGAIAPWHAGIDNIVTHLALVESALLKELQL